MGRYVNHAGETYEWRVFETPCGRYWPQWRGPNGDWQRVGRTTFGSESVALEIAERRARYVGDKR